MTIWCHHFRNWHPSCVSVCLVFLIIKLKDRDVSPTILPNVTYHLNPDVKAGAPRHIGCADKEFSRRHDGRANHLALI